MIQTINSYMRKMEISLFCFSTEQVTDNSLKFCLICRKSVWCCDIYIYQQQHLTAGPGWFSLDIIEIHPDRVHPPPSARTQPESCWQLWWSLSWCFIKIQDLNTANWRAYEEHSCVKIIYKPFGWNLRSSVDGCW